MITIQTKAPDFDLQGVLHNEIRTYKSHNYKTKWLILFFYPLDFSFVCPTEIMALNESYEEFKKAGAELFGISIDSVYSHQAWAKELGDLNFPLLSDLNKRLAHQYGVLDEAAGVAERATFIVDPEGKVRWLNVSSGNIGRSIAEILRSLRALQTNKTCPANWQPGSPTLS